MATATGDGSKIEDFAEELGRLLGTAEANCPWYKSPPLTS